MNSALRELFEQGIDGEPPDDLAERAVRSASGRRRHRLVTGVAVAAAAAVVLGVVLADGQLRPDAEPSPTDVATIPRELPTADSGATLLPGQMQSAAVAYLADGAVALVDASTGEVATVNPRGTSDAPIEAAVGIALSPDGTSLLIDYGSHLDILRVAEASFTEVRRLRPVNDAGATTVARPSAYVWENDSSHFICSCAVEDGVPQLVRVTDDGTYEPIDSNVSPLQVASGSGGAAVQLEAQGGPWWITRLDGSAFADDGPTLPAAQLLTMGRGREAAYLAVTGDRFSIGNVYESQPTASGELIGPPGVFDFATAIGVDAADDGYVVTTAAGVASPGNQSLGADGVQVQGVEMVFIDSNGEQQVLTSLPDDTEDASVASNLVGAPGPAPLGTLPNALPSPERLPLLSGGDVETASAAYIADEALVVVDAKTGGSFAVDALGSGLDGTNGSTFLAGQELSLSPDGRYLVLSDLPVEGRSTLSFFDIGRADFVALPVELAAIGERPEPGTRMAWSDGSARFSCVCTSGGEITQLQTVDVATIGDGVDATVTRDGVQPSRLASAPKGMLGRFEAEPARWKVVPGVGADHLEPAAYGLALARRVAADVMLLGPDPSSYLRWWTGGVFNMSVPQNGQTNYTQPRWLAGVWGPEGPVLVTYSRGDIPSRPLEVSYVEWDGSGGSVAGLHAISSLPEGTTAAAFSALVVP